MLGSLAFLAGCSTTGSPSDPGASAMTFRQGVPAVASPPPLPESVTAIMS